MIRPTIELNGNINTTLNSNSSISAIYKHIITSYGGIGNVVGNPFGVTSTYLNNAIYNDSSIITTTITDSVGCSKTITG
jgi:hypothetical protein